MIKDNQKLPEGNLLPIPMFEGYFIDSASGIVYSTKSNKWLTPKPNRVGYARTQVWNKGKRVHIFNHIKNVEVHGDLKGIKIPPFCETLRECGLSIDHGNGNKMDPRQLNLELMTHKENCKKAHNVTRGTDIPDLV